MRFERSLQCATRSLCALVLAWLGGCAADDVNTITLSGVVRGGQPLSGAVAADALQVARGGAWLYAQTEMPLQSGDLLVTGPDSAAVVSFPGGHRAYIYPDARMRIGSIFDEIGKVFLKVKEKFKAGTTFVTAGSEGTQYWIDVKGRDEVRVVVVEDAVRLSSNNDAWPPRRIVAGQQVDVRGPGPPLVAPANPADINREVEWVRQMDQLVPVKTAMSPWVPVLIGVGIGAAVLHDQGGGDKPATTTPGRRDGGDTRRP